MDNDARLQEISNIEKKLLALKSESASLQQRLAKLRSLKPELEIREVCDKVQPASTISSFSFPDAPVTKASQELDKLNFLSELFFCRRDIYAERFESRKSGKSGYQPVCVNLWKRPLCQKPKVKCHGCPHRILAPLTTDVLSRHLEGLITVGVYPLLQNDQCRFLVADFDKKGWHDDVSAFLQVCRSHDIPAALERSRSGNGGHVWIFFANAISARAARQMGSSLITETMMMRPDIGLDSYDRLFPNQDNLPKGGFGNLIALPLQRGPALRGNSLFLDDSFGVYPDQWSFLSSLERMQSEKVEQLAYAAKDAGRVIGVRPVSLSDEISDPWTLPPSRRVKCRKKGRLLEGAPKEITVVLSDEIYVSKEHLPPVLLNEIVRLAAFQNPEFYRAQSMRLPVYGKPRVIGCADDTGTHIGLPRGCLDDLRTLFQGLEIKLSVEDKRFNGEELRVGFEGELWAKQAAAVSELLKHDFGVLSASTAFGKTVVAAYMIAKRGVNALVLVHRRQLMDQWLERLCMFLDIDRKQIGVIGGGKRKPTGVIDVAVMQSLCRKGEVDDIVADYGHVIVDECHHISARSFELISRRCKPRYMLGLTATVVRKDGHHPIVYMQCGPVRFRTNDKEEAAAQPFDHVVEVINTDFVLPADMEEDKMQIQDVYKLLVEDENRNHLIADRASAALKEGRSPVLLTERRQHLDWFSNFFEGRVEHLVVLHGGMGIKERRAKQKVLADTAEKGTPRLVLATGKYLGEGFDDSRLDTLLLAMPVSWRGTIAQYAGRLHRLASGKREVVIYDFLDHSVPVLKRMFERRRKGYLAIGYSFKKEGVKLLPLGLHEK